METFCEFRIIESKQDEYFCPVCDPDLRRVIKSPTSNIKRKCILRSNVLFEGLRLGMTYSQSVVEHKIIGGTATQEEINDRLSICSTNQCGHFAKTYCDHPKCGCEINGKHKPLFNMLAMITKQCPLKYWGKIKR